MKRKVQANAAENGSSKKNDMKRTQATSRTVATKTTSHSRGESQYLKKTQVARGRKANAVEKENIVDDEGSSENDERDSEEVAIEASQSEPETTNEVSSVRSKLSPTKPQLRTPNTIRHVDRLFATPTKAAGITGTDETPRLRRNIDRSARRKSTRTLIERTILGNISDNDDEEEDIANQIYESGEEGEPDAEDEQNTVGLPDDVGEPSTPSKRGRGRVKGSKARQRSLTPPEELAPHDLYFSQNRPGRSKTANSNLSSLALLDHEEFFKLARDYKDQHATDMNFLQDVHAKSFNQWQFELSQDFNICVYGWGSKRPLLLKFAEHIYERMTDHSREKIVVINGYVQNLTTRDVLNTVAGAIAGAGTKLGSQPTEMLDNLISLLDEDETQHITLVIHSIDGAVLRRSAAQMVLSRLSSHPQVHLIASADHPSFPLLWDSSLRSTFNFLFHDCTTFLPYTVEIDVVDEVHDLLGRSGRKVGGKGGISFVLKSLPENAKSLFRVLIGEQLAAMDENVMAEDEEGDGMTGGINRRSEPGVEYRVLYQKAVEEFICSNEMNFRTLLKEFHDHQMIESRKDALGTEMLRVPFRKEELENILEDINPVILVLGATGTGKSQLAVDLAKRFNGEVINGDAMQMYTGLPIITNKITLKEQEGIPHHLLGTIPLEAEPWTVGTFKEKANNIISEVQSRGRLPIVVGGTHYYIQSLLFEDALALADDPSKKGKEHLSAEELSSRFPILDAPTEDILAKLKEVDPIMAERWHPNDRRKIQNSLQIFLRTGKKASDLYNEQREGKANTISGAERGQPINNAFEVGSPLLFWVHSELDSLKMRLDKRVDKMVEAGLMDEVTSLDTMLQKDLNSGLEVDLSRGIWASIGWKEFEPYLHALRGGEASQKQLDTLYDESLLRMKAATRQYAKRQFRWIRLKLMPELIKRDAVERLFLMDGTDVASWANSVSDPAIHITGDFLLGNSLPNPSELSALAKEFLNYEESLEQVQSKDRWVPRTCDICHTIVMTEKEWQVHFTTRAHRRMMKKYQKAAATG
ncbi:origin recognition complex subunit 2 protein [Rutstroemia sp. NJR-2017a BBW]|nr:origin recognition complex subunit 2 protein [Rutstroemia sp. NJR-2017a BBW]